MINMYKLVVQLPLAYIINALNNSQKNKSFELFLSLNTEFCGLNFCLLLTVYGQAVADWPTGHWPPPDLTKRAPFLLKGAPFAKYEAFLLMFHYL